MITSVRISNFRSLGENVSLSFGSLTALVGPNGSGKSNVVDALRFVADSMQIGLNGAITHRNGIDAVRRWSGGHPFDVSITLNLRLPVSKALPHGGTASYGFALAGDRSQEFRVKEEEATIWVHGESYGFRVEERAGGRDWVRPPAEARPSLDAQSLVLPLLGGVQHYQSLVQELLGIAIYSIYPDTLRRPQPYSPQKPMDRHGANWVSILKDQPRKSWQNELVSALARLTGDLEDIRVTRAAGYLVVEFKHRSPNKKPKWFAAAQESDGTLRVAGIISALLQVPSVPIIGVEEPELTVHPGAIPLLLDYLKQARRESQVIITTHSPELLDGLDADDIRVVERTSGITTVGTMEQAQRDAVKRGLLTLGEVMRNEGIQLQLPFSG